MIKLIVVSSSSPSSTHAFDRDTVIIGKQGSASADLTIAEDLIDQHVQITKQTIDNLVRYTVTNLAHDPFVTLNNLSFGKKNLQVNDILQIGDTAIRIEFEVAPVQQEDPATTLTFPQTSPPDLKLKKVPTTPPKLEKSTPPVNTSYTAAQPPIRTQRLSLKDYYLSEYDEDNEGETQIGSGKINSAKPPVLPVNTSPASNSAKTGGWKKGIKILASFCGVIALSFGLSLLWVAHHSADSEIRAARSISDVAMALSYADIKQIHPKNQNWSDPEFIHSTLTSVLGPEYPSLADFDHQGLFASSSYMLRIYTSSNLSQFLIIAQPAPSLFQWLAPKAPLVIDSRAMEIRKIKDLKSLNRLLVNANMSEGAHSEEISELVRQGELIPLSLLADKRNRYGFIPTTALPLMRPGADNYVYNAPRYYILGQTFLNKSLDIVKNTASLQEIALFQQELSSIAEYSDIILYTDQGIQTALEAQKAIALLAPKDKFMIAYLLYDDVGSITGSHIILDDTPNHITEIEYQPLSGDYSPDDLFATNLSSAISESYYNTTIPSRPTIDHRDPLFLRLSALAITRQQALKPVYDEMCSLLDNEMATWTPEFSSHISQLQQEFLRVDEEQHQKICYDLSVIASDMSYIPASCFMEFIIAADLEPCFQDHLNKLKMRPYPIKISASEIENQTKLIDQCANWNDLEAYTSQISSRLTFDNVPDSETLVSYQNEIRTHVIQRLNHFLLSTDVEPLPQEAFMPEYRIHLVNILEASWIIDPETHSFYLDEFDLRSAPMRVFKLSENGER